MEQLSHARVGSDLRKALAQARLARGLTQKELALSLNLRPSAIANIEAGRALADNALTARLERRLQCALPRTAANKKRAPSAA